jgi:archaeal flagellar protein FlaJ
MGKYLRTSGLEMDLRGFLKIIILIAILFLPGIFIAYTYFGLFIAAGVFVALLIIEGLAHYIVLSLSKKRAALAEEMIPDALRLIASNLRAGIIPEKAFMESARPEFGPLSIQIKEAGKSIMLGSSIKHAFMKIPDKIDSEVLRKTINLVAEGITRGANLASLLDGLADDMKSSSMLKKDIQAQVASYSMFIFLAIGFGAPILFSASLFLVETLIGLGSILPTQTLQTGSIHLAFAGISITKEFLLYYQIALMCVSSLFGGILMGMISEGKEFAGIKYVPLLITLNLVIFYLVKYKILASFAIF